MKEWNVIVTVFPRPGCEHNVLHELRLLGDFHPCQFKDVCLGRVDDATEFLEAIRQATDAGAEWAGNLARAIPLEKTFHFTPDTLAEKLKEAVTSFAPRLTGGTFHVRLERRGLIGQIMSPAVERSVADHLFTLVEKEGRKLHTSFEDADFILAIETVGNECGLALLTRELRQRYPFVQTR